MRCIGQRRGVGHLPAGSITKIHFTFPKSTQLKTWKLTRDVKMPASCINCRPEQVPCCVFCPQRKLTNTPSSFSSSSHIWPIFQCLSSSLRYFHSFWFFELVVTEQKNSGKTYSGGVSDILLPQINIDSCLLSRRGLLDGTRTECFHSFVCQSVFSQQRQQAPFCCLSSRMSVPNHWIYGHYPTSALSTSCPSGFVCFVREGISEQV